MIARMKTVSIVLSIVLVAGLVALGGCSDNDDSGASKKTSPNALTAPP